MLGDFIADNKVLSIVHVQDNSERRIYTSVAIAVFALGTQSSNEYIRSLCA